MSEIENEQNFKFASSLIKIIAILVALMVMIISHYALILFAASMLPTIIAIFIDKNEHRCFSATICSFNLIGVMPYLICMWESSAIDFLAKQLLADVSTWMVIYGAAFTGQLLYASMPLLIVKLYSAKMKVRAQKYEVQRKKICTEWGIE